MTTYVYIATSLDGYIADSEGNVDWLHEVPNPDNDDLGFNDFISGIDAIVMGKNTFEQVVAFGVWPYPVPVYVLSNSLNEIPEGYQDKATLMSGTPTNILSALKQAGQENLYIDGGKVIQDFLAADLIDELIISQLPIILGDGSPLFATLSAPLRFTHVGTEVLLDQIVKNHYKRMK